MLNREQLLNQMAAIEQERKQHEHAVAQCEGGINICRHFLRAIDEAEARQQADKAAEVANRNGLPCDGKPVEN